MSFGDVLRRRARETPGAPAFRFLDSRGVEREVLGYAALERAAEAVAHHLRAQSAPGDRVALLVPPGLGYATAVFACFFADVVAVPAYPPRRRRRSVEASGGGERPGSSNPTDPTDTTEDDPRVAHLLRHSGARLALVEGADGLIIRETGVEPTPTQGEVPSDLALLQYTSGSTGSPRGVMITHRQLLAHAALLQEAVPHHAGETAVFWIPPYHDMGLMGAILQAVYTGVCSVLIPPATFLQRPLTWLEAMSRYRAVSSAAPDSAYRECVARVSLADAATLDLSAWRIAFNGAEPVNSDTIKSFSIHFSASGFKETVFVPCYGLAEATLFVSGGPVGANPLVIPVGDRAVVACGRIAPGTQVMAVDPETGLPTPEGLEGELWVHGPQVATGYWNDPEATTRSFCHLWLRTGDLGVVVGDQLAVTGRLKELLIINGRNVYPQDLERAAEGAHVAIRRGGSAAGQDGAGRVVIVVELTREPAPETAVVIHAEVATAVRQACAEAEGVRVDEVRCVGPRGLPRTSSGKRRRGEAVNGDGNHSSGTSNNSWGNGNNSWGASNNGLGQGNHSSWTVEGVRAFLVDWIARERGGAVRVDASLTDNGLDSMAVVRLHAAIEDQLGQSVEPSLLWGATSVAALASALCPPGYLPPETLPPAPPVPLPAVTRLSLAEDLAAFHARRAQLDHAGNPFFLSLRPTDSPVHVEVGGARLLSFASYDYLGLAADPRVREAAATAARELGTSASASRLIGGERDLHGALEAALARFTGTQAALVFTSGHATNVSVIAQLVGPGDVVFCDERLHNSGWLGARHSGARVVPFPHNDANAADRLMQRERGRHGRALLIIEGLYSADGTVPDMQAFVALKTRHDALMMVDDAHGFGVLGATGRGVAERCGVPPEAVDLWMGTLSKAFAAVGGFVAGSNELIEWLRFTCPGFVFSAGMPPQVAAAALTAVELAEAEPWRVARLRENAQQLRTRLQMDSDPVPIIPIITGSTDSAVAMSQRLRGQGVLAAPMIPPAVPEGAARIRLFITAMHSAEHLGTVAEVLRGTEGRTSAGSERQLGQTR